MFHSLDTISEDDTVQEKVQVQGSSDTADYDDLPTATPKVRSFTDTIIRRVL